MEAPLRDRPTRFWLCGIRLQQVRQYDGALAAYKQVLQRAPASPHAHYNIAQISNDRGQYAEAQREYESALRADPQFLDARLNLGVVLYRQRQFTAAAEAFRQILQASPTHPMGLFNLGVTLLDRDRADEASGGLRRRYARTRRGPIPTTILAWRSLGRATFRRPRRQWRRPPN